MMGNVQSTQDIQVPGLQEELTKSLFELGNDDDDLYGNNDKPSPELEEITQILKSKNPDAKLFWDFESDDDLPATAQAIEEIRKFAKPIGPDGQICPTRAGPKIYSPDDYFVEPNSDSDSESDSESEDLEVKLERTIRDHRSRNEPIPHFSNIEMDRLVDQIVQKIDQQPKIKLSYPLAPTLLNFKKNGNLPLGQINHRKIWDEYIDQFRKPPEVTWCYTNTAAICFDCNNLIENSKKGYGEGLTCMILYFCEKCYLARGHRLKQKTPIDFDLIIPNTKKSKAKEEFQMNREYLYIRRMYKSRRRRQEITKKNLHLKKQAS